MAVKGGGGVSGGRLRGFNLIKMGTVYDNSTANIRNTVENWKPNNQEVLICLHSTLNVIRNRNHAKHEDVETIAQVLSSKPCKP